MIKINANFLLRNTSIRAITIFVFVLFRDKKDYKDKVLLNHERIHVKQQLEMLFIPFLIWYFLEYFIRLVKYKWDDDKAYRSISFEAEAYDNEYNFRYKRKLFAWVKYLKK